MNEKRLSVDWTIFFQIFLSYSLDNWVIELELFMQLRVKYQFFKIAKKTFLVWISPTLEMFF